MCIPMQQCVCIAVQELLAASENRFGTTRVQKKRTPCLDLPTKPALFNDSVYSCAPAVS
jgi:hypothetical protein